MDKKKISVNTSSMKKYPNFREPIGSGKELAGIKVTNTVGTFLNEDSNGLHKIRVTTTKVEPEKITNMGGTFLNEDRNGSQKIGIMTTKAEPKKVTSTVGTFLDEDRNELWIIRVNKCFTEIFKQFWQMKLFKKISI